MGLMTYLGLRALNPLASGNHPRVEGPDGKGLEIPQFGGCSSSGTYGK